MPTAHASGPRALELAVAVELVAEEVREQKNLGSDAASHLRQGRLVDLEQPQFGVTGSEEGGGDPETRFAPALLWATRTAGRRISAAIAVVVVLPFVAEMSAEPCSSRAASRSIAPGSSFQRSFPGRVVPPPRPASRESAPALRRTADSSESGMGGRTGGER